jgi:hypothetical protein
LRLMRQFGVVFGRRQSVKIRRSRSNLKQSFENTSISMKMKTHRMIQYNTAGDPGNDSSMVERNNFIPQLEVTQYDR